LSSSDRLGTDEGVLPPEARIEGVGVRALDRRRVDVAVDLSPSAAPLTIDIVIVGPSDDELCSILIVDSWELYIDRIMHLRQDALPGVHTLHVGLFHDNLLVDRTSREFDFGANGETQ
jgi:hypothetical protein